MLVCWEKMLFLFVMFKTLSTGYSGNRTTSRNERLHNKPMTSSRMAKKITNPKLYDKSEPPPQPGGEATIVELGIYINSFYAISEQTMDYSLNIYLRQQWSDPRLQFEPFNGEPSQKLKLEDHYWDRIWTPDVFFRNEKHADYHEITTPNRLLNLHSSGRLWYVSKITAELSCPMRLHKYPMDTQICPMMFESFGYTMEHIVFKWLPEPVQFESMLELPQYRLVNFTLEDCSQNYTTGAYPCLRVDFILKRDIGYYMIQLYVPSVLIVILSWVAFWISIDAIPARVTIGLLTVLTMTTQSTGARASLPRVSYIKAIDVWMSMCLIFVFASLLEFAVVNVFSRKEIKNAGRNSFKHLKKAPMSNQRVDEEIALEQINIVTHNGRDFREIHRGDHNMAYRKDSDGRQKARYIDKLSRKLFPLAFLSFNLIYWLAYILG